MCGASQRARDAVATIGLQQWEASMTSKTGKLVFCGICLTLAACGESRAVGKDLGGGVGADALGQLDGARIDSAPLDARGSDLPTDLTSCGGSVIDGNLGSSYFQLGCPPSDTCPLSRSTSITGKTGWPVSESRGCTLQKGHILTARVVLAAISEVTLRLTTPTKVAAETSFRNQCKVRQCGQPSGNTATLEAGEHTIEVMTADPTTFTLEVKIEPATP
jgi:hypothetical protein